MTRRRQKKSNDSSRLDDLPRATLTFVEPMLAKLSPSLPSGDSWWYEIKFDGYRCLALKKGNSVTLLSRRGNKLNQRFPSLPAALESLPDKTMIDGEVVALDEQGRPSFAALQNSLTRRRRLYFYVFDLLAYKGRDTRRLELAERRKFLEAALRDARDPVRASTIFHEKARTLISAVRKQGLEGILAKRAGSLYESGERTGAWLKYKTNRGQELVIGGYQPGSNGFESLLVGFYEGKKLIFIAKIKNGFTPALRRQIAKRFSALETKVCPFANLPEPKNARRGKALTAEVMKEMRWLRPRLVAQIEFTDWTSANHLRHSKFVALRDDKNAEQVFREK